MGNSQSTPSDAVVQEKLVEQLTALQLQPRVKQQELEKEYVKVDFKDSPPAYREDSQTVSISTAEQWEKELLEDPKNRLALSALLSNPLPSIISQKVATLSDRQTFNIKVAIEGSPITNQRSSGRCWLFAATNVFRVAIMKKHDLKDFELSQAYLFFWDKLEKANYFLEQIIDTSEEELDSRLIQELLKAPVNDGGQWDMVANLVAKYGLVGSHHEC
jgi:bleomycin hydrolase